MEKILNKNTTPLAARLSRNDAGALLVSLLGFFTGRVVMFEFLNPVAVSYLSVFMGAGYRFYLTAAFIGLGMATRLKGPYLAKYYICLAMMIVFNYVLYRPSADTENPKIKKRRPGVKAQYLLSAGGAICVLIPGLLLSIYYGFGIFFTASAILETIFVFSLIFIMKNSAVLFSGAEKRSMLDNDDIISVAVLLGAVIAGASDIYIGNVSLRYFLSIWVLLVAGYKGGCSLGAAAGVLLGLMLFLAGYWDVSLIGILGVCGILSGLFKNNVTSDADYRPARIKTLAVFWIGGYITAYYINRYILNIEMLFSLILSSLAFLMTPERFYFNFAFAINPVTDNSAEYIERVKEATNTRLMAFSSSFEKLARTLGSLYKKKTSMDKNDIANLIDDLAANACRDCKKRRVCWDENFYATYQTVFGMLDDYEKKGWIETENTGCINKAGFYNTAARMFDLHSNNMLWNNKIIESRELVSQQLMGVSSIIRELADELDIDIRFNEAIEESILIELSRNNMEVDNVIVLENNQGKYEVNIKHKTCLGKKKCVNEIIPVVNSVLKRKMRADDGPCIQKKGICNLRLYEEKKYRITSGVSRLTKNGGSESGDSYSFMELKNGKCILVLSDGMGSGSRAREESAATVELLEDFIESGFEKELAVKIINSVLVLKSNEELFSTLDICSIDLYTGEAEFIKIGASSTYLLRDGRVSVIQSASLPMGMLHDVDVEVSVKKLKHNDIIIMATDGILEIGGDTYANKEEWLVDAILHSAYLNPQDMADYLIIEAENRSGSVISDDITVLAARIWEKK